MKNLKVKVIIAAATAAVIGACFVGSTFAYFKDTKEATNNFSMHNVTTEIVENFEKVEGSDTSFTKEVAVKNTDVTDCLVRVRVNVTPATSESNIKIDNMTYDEFLASCTQNSDWYYNAEDGFFYYMDALSAGETTSNLMNTVDIIDADAMEDFDIIVYEESVQTAVYTGQTSVEFDGTFETIDAIFNAYEAQSETEPTT